MAEVSTQAAIQIARIGAQGLVCGPAFGVGATPITNPFLTALLATSPLLVYKCGDVGAGAADPVIDSTGNGFNGTTGAFVAGGINLASLLPNGEGSSLGFLAGAGASWINFPYVPAIYNLNRDVTLSGWFKINQTAGGSGSLIQCGTSGLATFIYLGPPWTLAFSKSNISISANFTTPLIDGNTYWIVLTISAAGVYKMYINNVLDAITGTTVTDYTGSAAPGGQIGNNAFSGGQQYGNNTTPNAQMQYIALHTTALSAGQISALWTAAQ